MNKRPDLQAMLKEIDRQDGIVKEILTALGVDSDELEGDMPALYEQYWKHSNTLRGMVMAHVRT